MSEPTPAAPEPTPVGTVSSAISGANRLVKTITGLDGQQAQRGVILLLIAFICVMFGWQLIRDERYNRDRDALTVRAYEAAEERGRQFYASEVDKARHECVSNLREMRTAYVAEQDKNRLERDRDRMDRETDRAERTEWRRMLSPVLRKLMKDDGGEEFDDRALYPLAPMPRLLHDHSTIVNP